MKMRHHFFGGKNRFILIALTVFLFAVVFSACEKENKPENNTESTPTTVSETSPFENTTFNSQLNTSLPQYAFEDEDEEGNQITHNDTADTTASSNSSDDETENSTVDMPPKADSQQGEWGASVNN